MARLAFSYSGKDSLISKMNPSFKLLYLITFSILITNSEIVSLYPIFVALVFIGMLAKLNIIKEIIQLPFLLLVSLLITYSNFRVDKNLYVAISEAIRFIDLIFLSLLFMETTDIDVLSSSLARYLSKIIGKRAWKLSSYIMLTLSLLPMIFKLSKELLDARKARGVRFFRHPIKNVTDYTNALVIALIDKSLIFMDALYSRAFDPITERSSEKAKAYDIITFVCVIALLSTIYLMKKTS